MASAAFLSEVTGEKGVSPDRLSAALHITKSELALAAGLSRDAVSKAARSQSVVTQARLREVSEIINRVIPPGTARSRCLRSVTPRPKNSSARASARRSVPISAGSPPAGLPDRQATSR